jgi:hypothetical protein
VAACLGEWVAFVDRAWLKDLRDYSALKTFFGATEVPI